MKVLQFCLGCLLGLFFVFLVIMIDSQYSSFNKRKEQCESKGGVYTQPRDVGPQCIKKEYYIEVE